MVSASDWGSEGRRFESAYPDFENKALRRDRRRAFSLLGQRTALDQAAAAMNELPKCPQCDADYTYQEGVLLICPSCAHEWNPASKNESVEDRAAEGAEVDAAVRDANGNTLQTGASVIVIKDLKVKGSSLVVKGGTKVKNIRLVEGGGVGGHNIDCKIDGVGSMTLKSEFVKKA